MTYKLKKLNGDIEILSPDDLISRQGFFVAKEIACPCCNEIRVEPGFIDAVSAIRRVMGIPFHVNNCCRCDNYSADLKRRGYKVSPTSLHLMSNKTHGTATCAIDISLRNFNKHQVAHLKQILDELGWSYIITKTYIHIANRKLAKLKPHRVVLDTLPKIIFSRLKDLALLRKHQR